MQSYCIVCKLLLPLTDRICTQCLNIDLMDDVPPISTMFTCDESTMFGDALALSPAGDDLSTMLEEPALQPSCSHEGDDVQARSRARYDVQPTEDAYLSGADPIALVPGVSDVHMMMLEQTQLQTKPLVESEQRTANSSLVTSDESYEMSERICYADELSDKFAKDESILQDKISKQHERCEKNYSDNIQGGERIRPSKAYHHCSCFSRFGGQCCEVYIPNLTAETRNYKAKGKLKHCSLCIELGCNMRGCQKDTTVALKLLPAYAAGRADELATDVVKLLGLRHDTNNNLKPELKNLLGLDANAGLNLQMVLTKTIKKLNASDCKNKLPDDVVRKFEKMITKPAENPSLDIEGFILQILQMFVFLQDYILCDDTLGSVCRA